MHSAQPRRLRKLIISNFVISASIFGLLTSPAQSKNIDNAFDIEPSTEPKKTEPTDIEQRGRMKAHIQFNAHPEKGTASSDKDNAPPGGVRTTPTVITGINSWYLASPTGLDYDLYLRRYDESMPHAYSGQNKPTELAWQGWSSRILADIHSLEEKVLTIPGYADFVVTAQPDGHCTAKLITLMGGPQFKEQALNLIDQMNQKQLLHYDKSDQTTPQSVSFKMGAGCYKQAANTGNLGHFWCGVESELPNAPAQLKNRYADCHQ